jgi:hypothetical protein
MSDAATEWMDSALQDRARVKPTRDRSPIPDRKTPPSIYGAVSGDYRDVIYAKATRKLPSGATPGEDQEPVIVSSPDIQEKLQHNFVFSEWDIWDFTVLMGVLFLFVGLISLLFVVGRSLVVLVPLGTILIALGGYKSHV